MTGHNLMDGQGGLKRYQLAELYELHRQYGLEVRFAHSPGALTYGGRADELVTELLRLAAIGALAEARRAAGGDYERLLLDADVEWKRRLRP